MSAPLVWIFVPGGLAVVLFFTRHRPRLTSSIGALAAAGLAWAAWRLPINTQVTFGPVAFTLTDTFSFLGRQFILENSNRPVLILIYLAAAFWFGGTLAARPRQIFVPFGLGIVTLMTAALAVEPFLYAALLIEMAALFCVPLLAVPGKSIGRGVIRFLTFQTLGMPFILFTGWMLTGIGTTPGDMTPVLRAAMLLSLGFSLLLAVFPFHTWIPMLAEEAHPYTAAFVFFMMPGIVSLFGLDFFERFAWLRQLDTVALVLRGAGVLMIVTSGLWAAFQRHLGRMLAYALTADIGLSILAVGLHPDLPTGSAEFPSRFTIFTAIFLSRGLALGIWALALTVIQNKEPNLQFRAVQGLGRQLPVAATGVVLAHLSMAGFPLLSGFPPHMAIWAELARTSSWLAFLAILGNTGLLVGSLRTLAVLVMGKEEDGWKVTENRTLLLFLGFGILALFVVRYFP